MEKVLIHRDTTKLRDAQDFFNRSISFIQHVYNRFIKDGICLDFDDLINIVETLNNLETEPTWLHNTLLSIGISKNDNYVLPVSDNALHNIKSYIAKLYPVGMGVYRVEPNLMCLVNGNIIAKPDALTVIENRFSFYAENERGAALGKKLYQLANAANELNNYLINNRIKISEYGREIPGLIFVRGQYYADISFIRDQERLCGIVRTKTNTRTMNLDDAA